MVQVLDRHSVVLIAGNLQVFLERHLETACHHSISRYVHEEASGNDLADGAESD